RTPRAGGRTPPKLVAKPAPKTLTLGGLRLGCRPHAGRLAGARFPIFEAPTMAKAVTIKVKLVSSADTGFYYVAKKNSRTMTDKLVKKKYDPVARKHVECKESKIKYDSGMSSTERDHS